MKTLILTPEDVLRGYDAVSTLYPHVPPLSHWRAWEYAAYASFQIDGRVLDLGCGDGRYFRLLWPTNNDVVGVDMDPTVAELGRRSSVYRNVHVTAADLVPEPDSSFDSVFANCSLEHMDRLDGVLAEIHRCLKPGGRLLCSVVTDHFRNWAVLPHVLEVAGFDQIAATVRQEFVAFHNLVNPLSAIEWQKRLAASNLIVESYIPIVPRINSAAFLLMDEFWHVKRKSGGELGAAIHGFIAPNSAFPQAFRKIISGLLDMESDWQTCSGAVFMARKPG